jgi:chromosomal replication initiator protein
MLLKLREKIPEKSFNTWFSHITLEEADCENVVIGVANLFIKEWVKDHYSEMLQSIFTEILKATPKVTFKINGKQLKNLRKKQEKAAKEEVKVNFAPPADNSYNSTNKSREYRSSKAKINSAYTFDNFVPGACNIIAFEACRRIGESAAEFNPLIITGKCGTGKSHLAQAVWLQESEAADSDDIIYISAEEFTNEFMKAVINKQRAQFQNRYRNCSLLIVDDVQFFLSGNKGATQEELLHTIDALCNRGAQVVLTSTVNPSEMEEMEERLRKRIQSGLSIPLGELNRDTAIHITRAKAKVRKINLCEGTVDFIVREHGECIREIEGAVSRLAAFSRFGNIEIDPAMAKQILGVKKKTEAECAAKPGIKEIAKAVEDMFGVTCKEQCGRSRSKNIRIARMVAMVLSRDLTGASFAEIGNFFGGRKHATVLTGIKSARGFIENDKAISTRVKMLKKRFPDCGEQTNLF